MSDSTARSSSLPKKPKFSWTPDTVYNMVISKFWSAMKCGIYPEDTIFYMLYEANLMDEWSGSHGERTGKLFKAVCSIERAFNIKIVNSYTVDDIVIAAKTQLNNEGRLVPDAPDIKAIKRQQTAAYQLNGTGHAK